MKWWVKRKLHISDIIGLSAAGLIIGVALSFWLNLTALVSVVWLAVAMLLFALCAWRKTILVIPLAVIAGLIIGTWRTDVSLIQLRQIQKFNGQTITISGNVFEDPDIKEDGTLTIKLNNLRLPGSKLEGNIFAQISGKTDIKRSDNVTLSGKLGDSFGSFAGSMFRAQVQNITRPKPGDIARQVRDWFGGLVRKVIPETEADLGLGYLVGQRKALSDSMVEILKLTGLTHIVVASGYNLTIIVRFTRRLFIKISKFTATFAAFTLIVSFILVAGVSPSMLRAGLVAGLSLLAWYYGRKFHPANLILLVAAITLLLSPSYIVDLGWLLSFGSFVGVLLVAPFISAYFFGKQKVPAVPQILIETFSAQICVMPILIYFFGQISVVSLLTNMLVLPTIPLAMLLVFLAGATYLVWPLLAQVVGFVATWLIRYHQMVMNYFGNLSWAMFDVNFNLFGVAICYTIIATVTWYMKQATGYQLMRFSVVE